MPIFAQGRDVIRLKTDMREIFGHFNSLIRKIDWSLLVVIEALMCEKMVLYLRYICMSSSTISTRHSNRRNM